MIIDHHTHHYRCGHATGTLQDVIEAAIAKGLDGIGLSDHSPIYHLGDGDHVEPGKTMAKSELGRYVEEMAELKERYRGKIDVKLGVESDHVDGWEEHYRRLWQSYDLDYVIGSVHWLGTWNIFEERLPEGKDAWEIYEAYLLSTQRAARSKVYDIIGHLDCLKTRGHMPTTKLTPLLEETVRVIAECDVAIELNTSGWRKSIAECYPRRELLECCLHYGVPVALGSDAHSPDQVAADFDRACQLLWEVGYREVVTFTKRKRESVPIDLTRARRIAG